MKIKISDLVNKVINREEMPKEVLFNGNIYKWCDNIGDYRKDGWGSCLMIRDIFNKFDRYGSFYNMLFEDVEIIEEQKKIEKLETYKEKKGEDYFANILKLSPNSEFEIDEALSTTIDKLNELIDEINNSKEKKEK